MPMRQTAGAVLIAFALGGGFIVSSQRGASVLGPGVNMCDVEWVKQSWFWCWYYGCFVEMPAVNEPV